MTRYRSEITERPCPSGGVWHRVRTWRGTGTGFLDLVGETYTEGGHREAERVAARERRRLEHEQRRVDAERG